MSDVDRILIPHLVKEEGFVSHVYEDIFGFKTIGVGRMVDKRKGGGITRDEAEYLLRNDVERVKTAVREKLPWVNTLDPVRQAILYAMAFQMGVKGLLSFKLTLAQIEAGNYLTASRYMLGSKWARVDSPKRALRLSHAMETGEAQWLL